MDGKILKALRQERNATQQDVAAFLNLSYQAYAGYENGRRKPDPEILCKLADFFQCSVDYLLGREKTNQFIPSLIDTPTKTLNETELLEAFRSLDEDEQQAIIQTAKIMQKAKEKQK